MQGALAGSATLRGSAPPAAAADGCAAVPVSHRAGTRHRCSVPAVGHRGNTAVPSAVAAPPGATGRRLLNGSFPGRPRPCSPARDIAYPCNCRDARPRQALAHRPPQPRQLARPGQGMPPWRRNPNRPFLCPACPAWDPRSCLSLRARRPNSDSPAGIAPHPGLHWHASAREAGPEGRAICGPPCQAPMHRPAGAFPAGGTRGGGAPAGRHSRRRDPRQSDGKTSAGARMSCMARPFPKNVLLGGGHLHGGRLPRGPRKADGRRRSRRGMPDAERFRAPYRHCGGPEA